MSGGEVTRWLTVETPDGVSARFPLNQEARTVGRATATDALDKIGVAGDPSLSRQHFVVEVRGDKLAVRRCPEATNPIYYRSLETEAFTIAPGDHFTAGRSKFGMMAGPAARPKATPTELILAPDQRQSLRAGRAEQCLRALTELLPRMRNASGQAELFERAVELLRGLLPRNTEVAVVAPGDPVTCLAGDQFPASRGLVRTALDGGQTVQHVFDEREANYTQVMGVHWALAAPVAESFVLYAQGFDAGANPGEEQTVLVDLIGEALSHYLVASRVQQIGQFFSPKLRPMLQGAGFDLLLQPRLLDVTLVFFDMRGSCRTLEQQDVATYHHQLTELMTRLSACVFERDGIVIDYIGDALLACWGAPVEVPEAATKAVLAAASMIETSLALGHGCGAGVASGQVMTGQVGAAGQFKFGVVGQAANQAARLEGLTKIFGVPLLITGVTRARLADSVPCRYIARARPAGMDQEVELHEVVLPRSFGGTELTAEQIAAFEGGQRFAEDPVSQALTRLPSLDGVLDFQRKG
ncbi:MAG: hypothetical protein KC910_23190 [Candidatus Eremiobacteraeota bacterium]|nr:hypothetical protein [Candidatus Eremiobacteraeota bacterium]